MRKLSTIILLMGAACYGKSPFSSQVSVYTVNLDYSSNINKTDGTVSGIYASFLKGMYHQLELEFDETTLNFQDFERFRQTDLTVAYSRFTKSNTKLTTGFHQIQTDDTYQLRGVTYFTGVAWASPPSSRYGIKTYATFFDNQKKMFQVSSWYEHSLGRKKRFWSQTKLHIQELQDPTGDDRNTVFSLDQAFTYSHPLMSGGISISLGDQIHRAEKNGFVIWNDNATHTFRTELFFLINLKRSTFIKLTYNYDAFNPNSLDPPVDAKLQSVTVLFGHRFK